jgi:hypothetical protein
MDTDGNIIKSQEVSNKKGLQRTYWDYTTQWDLALSENDINRTDFRSFRALPGIYLARVYLENETGWHQLGNEVEFEVEQLRKGSLPSVSEAEMKAFWRELQQFNVQYQTFTRQLNKTQKQIDLLNKAYAIAKTQDTTTAKQLKSLQRQMANLDQRINGSKARAAVGEEDAFPKIRDLMRTFYAVTGSNYGPTALHRSAFEDAQRLLQEAESILNQLIDQAAASAKKLEALGAPPILD